MDYIVYRRFREKALCGDSINLPYGTELKADGNLILTPDGKPLCYATSFNAHKHFAINNDGRGLERGAITYAIAYAPRKRMFKPQKAETLTDKIANLTEYRKHKGSGRFTNEECEILERDWKKFLKPNLDVILFSHDFFTADIEELQKLADVLKIKV